MTNAARFGLEFIRKMISRKDKDMKKNDGFLSFAVVIGALLLFAKTADVMSYFSPSILNDIVGFNVSIIYGLVTAAMIEGMILALHFNQRAAFHSPAIWVKWLLIVISGVCQFYDGAITTNTLAQQTDTLKAVFQFGVPLIPLLIVVMIIWIGQLPDTGTPRKPFVGLKNIPSQFDWIWYGPEGRGRQVPKPVTNVPMTTNAATTNAPKLQESETANPTFGSNGKNHP